MSVNDPRLIEWDIANDSGVSRDKISIVHLVNDLEAIFGKVFDLGFNNASNAAIAFVSASEIRLYEDFHLIHPNCVSSLPYLQFLADDD